MRLTSRRCADAAFASAASALALHVALTGVERPGTGTVRALEAMYLGLIVFATIACLWRWRSSRADRGAWACLSLALLAWSAGEAHHALFLADLAITPFPSIGDAFFVIFYPLCFAAVCLLVRGSVDRIGLTLLLDGVVAAAAACAVLAGLTITTALRGLAYTDGALSLIFTLAYPVGDLILIGALAGGASLVEGRVRRDVLAVGAGLLAVATADAIHLATMMDGTYTEGSWIDSLWPAGLLMIAWGGWAPVRVVTGRTAALLSRLPVICSLAAVGILAIAEIADVDPVAQVLATVAVLGVVARMHLTLRENRRLLDASRREALTDPLTGLANRRQLAHDLQAALSAGADHHLFLFDLDGFKHYNDTFGHSAGDELLKRRAGTLTAQLRDDATAYRLGGDEFCVLVEDQRCDTTVVLDSARTALAEDGDGYAVRASWGGVSIPCETQSAADALVLADRRMYACKDVRKRGIAVGVSPDVRVSMPEDAFRKGPRALVSRSGRAA